LHEELLAIADRLEEYPNQAKNPVVKEPLDDLEEAATTIGKAWIRAKAPLLRLQWSLLL
jgi:hypothetical protein